MKRKMYVFWLHISHAIGSKRFDKLARLQPFKKSLVYASIVIVWVAALWTLSLGILHHSTNPAIWVCIVVLFGINWYSWQMFIAALERFDKEETYQHLLSGFSPATQQYILECEEDDKRQSQKLRSEKALRRGLDHEMRIISEDD